MGTAETSITGTGSQFRRGTGSKLAPGVKEYKYSFSNIEPGPGLAGLCARHDTSESRFLHGGANHLYQFHQHLSNRGNSGNRSKGAI